MTEQIIPHKSIPIALKAVDAGTCWKSSATIGAKHL